MNTTGHPYPGSEDTPAPRHGAFPWSAGPAGRGCFVFHAALALAALAALNVLIVYYVPFSIRGIGDSYLIFFYHFPAAINVFFFYAVGCTASALYLATRADAWDRRARVATEVGVLCNAVLLVTGSTWAKAAWDHWWVWNDPRLLSAAVMSLTYLGYLSLQYGLEDPVKRRTYAAVYGIMAFLNVPIVHYSIRWFGETRHPLKFDRLSDAEIVITRWYGVLAFFVFYLFLYRWKYDREFVRERADAALDKLRLLEEGRS